MSAAGTTPEITPATTTNSSAPSPQTLISLVSLPHEALDRVLDNLIAAFPRQTLIVATPDAVAQPKRIQSVTLLNYIPTIPTQASWVLSAADFFNTWKLVSEHQAKACLMLGPEAQSLSVEALRALTTAIISGRDLALPRYQLGPRDGLVNSAILYPVSRALFGSRIRFPLAIDVGLSPRMAEHLATAAQRFTAANQSGALLWPINEAAVSNCSMTEAAAGPRALPHPADTDLNTLLNQILSSFFSDIETKASFWQRVRLPQPSSPQPTFPASQEDVSTTVAQMLDSFRLAYTNLHELWALVLPPNSLLGLKKLSQLPPDAFRMPDGLWVRIVYDFILAFRLRTLNRGHLLGALTPLYLAWAASHLRLTASGSLTPEPHIEQLAFAFETDKSYLVSRWRWPDRFNP